MDKQLKLNLDDSLTYDANNELCIQSSSKPGNTLTVEPDGLYAQAIPGESGSGGTGYPDNYRSENGVVSGYSSPYSTTQVSKRIVGPAIVHRVFTCSNADGSDLIIRSLDRVFAGDLYRVLNNGNWDYYLIKSVNDLGNGVRTHSGVIASIPVTERDIN